jgi:hypothetical protein
MAYTKPKMYPYTVEVQQNKTIFSRLGTYTAQSTDSDEGSPTYDSSESTNRKDSDSKISPEKNVKSKVTNGYYPHANSTVTRCNTKYFECNTKGVSYRSGLIGYMTIKGIRYFSLSLDAVHSQLTDPGGKIFQNDLLGYEDPITGGARETKEETLEMLDFTSNSSIECLRENSTIIYNAKMCLIFQPVSIIDENPIAMSVEFQRRYTKFNRAITRLRQEKGGKLEGQHMENAIKNIKEMYPPDAKDEAELAVTQFLEANSKKMTEAEMDCKYRLAENKALVWLTENELNTLIYTRPNQEVTLPVPERLQPFLGKEMMPRLYERVRALLYVVLHHSSSII